MCSPRRSADVVWLVQLAAMVVAVVLVAWFVLANLAVLGLGLVAVVVVTVAWVRFLHLFTVAAGAGRLRAILAPSAAQVIQPPAAVASRQRAAIVAGRPSVIPGFVLDRREEVRR